VPSRFPERLADRRFIRRRIDRGITPVVTDT
jgi:hypothetical protein